MDQGGNGIVDRRYSLDGPACERINAVGKEGGGEEDDSVDTLYLTPEAYRATEAIEFIAGHLRSEDEYIQVRSTFILFLYLLTMSLSLSLCFTFSLSLSLSILPDHILLFHCASVPCIFYRYEKTGNT